MLLLGGKCSLSIEQIDDRRKKGARFLEFHTDYNDFLNIDKNKLHEIKKYLEMHNMQSYSIHSPMNNSRCASVLSEVEDKLIIENRELLKKSIEFALNICDYDSPIVVIHPSYEFNKSIGYNEKIFDKIKESFENELYYIDKYVKENAPNVRLGIENTCPVTIDKKTGGLSVHSGFIEPNYADYIKSLNLSNTGVVLDTCHAFSNIRLNKILTRGESNLSIIDYLKSTISNLELIHLNNLSFLGEVSSNHSTPFRKNGENYTDLKKIFKFLIDNRYKNPVTIEVLETNYSYGVNFEKTLKTCENLLSNTI